MLEYWIPVAGYLLGSIPFGYLFVKSAKGIDIRTQGSGNIGATNVFRESKWAGALTFLLDAGKGYLAVVVARWLGGDQQWQAATAVAAILGHIFPIWLSFKGGKGVATGCGSYLALSSVSVATALVVFVLTALLTRYISLASIVATATFPFLVYVRHEPFHLLFWAAAGSALIIAKHHQNIRRLLAGTEHKFALGGRS